MILIVSIILFGLSFFMFKKSNSFSVSLQTFLVIMILLGIMQFYYDLNYV